MTAPAELCRTAGCTAIGCTEHAAPRYPPQWKRVRDAYLAAEPWCAHCGTRAEEVDHVVSLADGGDPLDPANLQSLCRGCHRAKTGTVRGVGWAYGSRSHRRNQARREGPRKI